MLRAAVLLWSLVAAVIAADPAPLPADTRTQLDTFLMQLKGVKDPVLLQSPVMNIGKLGPAAVTAAAEALTPLLSHVDAQVRLQTLHVLAPPAELPEATIQQIYRLKADTDDEVRAAANALIDAIGVWRDQREREAKLNIAGQLPLPELLTALGGDDLAKREAAIVIALRRSLAEPEFNRALADQTAVLAKLCAHPDPRVREVALLAMGRGYDVLPPQATAAAVQASEDRRDQVAVAALFALGKAQPREREAVSALKREATTATRPRVRGQALATLAHMRLVTPEISAQAVDALTQPAAEAWPGACAALVSAGQAQPDAVPALERISADRKQLTESRIEALKALAIAGEPKRTLSRFITLLNDHSEPDPRLRTGAITALILMADDATEALPLLTALSRSATESDDLRNAAKAALDVIGRHRAK